jgi:hypothetical protein
MPQDQNEADPEGMLEPHVDAATPTANVQPLFGAPMISVWMLGWYSEDLGQRLDKIQESHEVWFLNQMNLTSRVLLDGKLLKFFSVDTQDQFLNELQQMVGEIFTTKVAPKVKTIFWLQ